MKTQTQHTPGPWTAAADGMKWQISTLAFVNEQTDGLDNVGTVPIQGTLKNARLIASAPDLLDALQVCIDSFEEMIGISDFGSPAESDFPLKQAREAIRKAQGEA
jgi:hypothetical protein